MLAGYFGQQTAAESSPATPRATRTWDEAAVRTLVMTDERYVARTERLADAQAAHGRVWRSRYDGPYTGLDDDPHAFAQYAPLLMRRARRGRRRHLAGRQACPQAALHSAWGKFATAGDPGWARYTVPRQTRDDLHRRRAAGCRPTRSRHVREVWSALDWQPGTWWSFDGLD